MTPHNFVRLLVFGVLLAVLLGAATVVIWAGNLRLAGQPTLFERPSLPRTARVGDLRVEVPPGYRVLAEGTSAWVGRAWPSFDLRQILAGLRLYAGTRVEPAEHWAERTAVCTARPAECRVRTDTVGGTVVECYETERRSGGRSDGSRAAECRVVDGTAFATYLCVKESCEVLRAVALTSLGSAGRGR